MGNYIFTPSKLASLAIKNSDALFPVHRLYCVGRNYADHAIEMGHDPNKEAPFFFQKNPDNLISDGRFPYPSQTNDVHHEVELVVALDKGGCNLSLEQAQQSIFGYAIGLDMTRRDLQAEMKKAGRSWEIGKAFEYSAPCSALTIAKKTIAKNSHVMDEGEIGLKINGEIRQLGNLNQMIWKIPEIIATLSQYFALKAGDLIMTGTPAGVGPVHRGDQLQAFIAGLDDFNLIVV